ncbi:hypothetical protein CEP54_010434 [Fusarium duplospermum]|uniref:Alpha/beta hydrolase fold-3 domain-containing protein n=1 Tax=Fusarium duplospermum TaxID=1325734 RepID=A0A428PK39_9HYPO|nr:hypothetical protein CEP54_010434 [Fusarium duplospermum]
MAPHGFWQYLRLKAIVSLIRFFNYLGTRRHLQPSPSCDRKQLRIPSRQLGRFIDAWIYYPPNYTKDEPRALVINWHGGGYVMPNLGQDHSFCEQVAREANVLVLDADYRKGPEHPFPGAAEDAEDTLRWVQSQPLIFDLDHVALSGFSSGANLALVASSELRREFKDISIKAVDQVVPEPIAPIPAWAQHVFTDSYFPRLEDRKSPKASPVYAKESSFPPHILLFVCSGDILCPEAEVFGQKLARAGCDIEVVKLEGAGHGFDKDAMARVFKPEEKKMAYAKVIESLKGIM